MAHKEKIDFAMKIKYVLLGLVLSASLCAAEVFSSDEVEVLSAMIRKTEERLAEQKELKENMIQFRELRQKFLANQEIRACAFKMTKLAPVILGQIDAYHMRLLFPSHYIEELEAFIQLREKHA